MQQFMIPQFIDVENKIIGPLTVRQFIIFLGAAGFIFLFFKIFTFFPAAILSVFTFGVAVVFAALKINGRAFHYFLLSLFQTFKRPTLKVWSKQVSYQDIKKEKEKKPPTVIYTKRPLTASHLTQLSLVVDTGGAYQEEE